MYWQYTPYVLPSLIAAAISAALALFAWRRRPAPGATPFTLLMVAVAEWSLGNALELGSTDLLTKGFWTKIEFLGVTAVPVLWLAFALQYTGREKWLTTRNLVLLAIEPLVTLLLHWTNEIHGLIARDVRLDTSGSLPVLDFTYGAGFWVHAAYSYLLLLLGTFLLLQALIRSPRLYRGQAGAVLIAALAPWVGNVLYISGLSPFPYLDLTPFAFTITGLAVAWGLFRFRLLDIVPVARDTVIEGMSDGVIVLDTQNRIVDLNPAAQRIIGHPASETIGQPAAQVFSAWPDLLERYCDVAEVCEELVLGKGEAQPCFELHISPLHDRGGRLTGRLIVLRDITERRRAEETLREERNLLRTLIDNLPDYIYVKDTESRYFVSNTAHVRFLGATTRGEVVGKTVFELFPQELAAQYYADDQEIIRSGQPLLNREERSVDQTGNEVWHLTTKVPLRDSHGKIVGLVGIARDITRRKQAEGKIAGLAKFPAENPNPVLRIAQDGVVLYANKASRPLLSSWGCQTGQLLPNDWCRVTSDALSSGTNEDAEVEIDDRVLSLTFAPVVDAGYVNVYGLDITERKRAEEVLKEYSERLEEMVEERTRELQDAHEQLIRREKLAVLGQMAASVSHELRNPLGTISNAAYYLKMVHTDADETTKEYLDIIAQEVRNSDRIISDLLDFSRTRLPDREKVAVSDLVTQVLEKQPPPKNVALTTHIALDLPPVYVDRHQMGQVLVNLVTNAYQSMSEGGNLTISAQAQEGAVTLSIADTGVGISNENMARLFEPLFTTKTKGLGLGLMVVKMLVEANEGSIEVKSEVGKGSTFVVILPTNEGVS